MFQILAKLFATLSIGLAASFASLSATSTLPTNSAPLLLADISPMTTISDHNDQVVATSTPEEISASLHYKITQLRNQIERDNVLRILSIDHPPRLGDKGDAVSKLQE